jgi:hypothetical protein
MIQVAAMYSHMAKEKMMGLVAALLIVKNPQLIQLYQAETEILFFTRKRCKKQKMLSFKRFETFAYPPKSSLHDTF